MSADCYHFTIGDIDCISINDYMSTYASERFFTNAPTDQVTQVLQSQGLESDLPAAYTCLFVNTGSNKVLIDTGMGTGVHPQRGPYQGNLLRILHEEGIHPEDIDTVVFTHAHGDHIGGSVDDLGHPVFPNARYVLWRDEWEFWTGDADLSSVSMPDGLKEMLVNTARKTLSALEGRVELLDSEVDIVPGVRAVEAKGHTPGHMAIVIGSGQEQLLYISDTVLHPLHLEHPEWQTAFYDYDVKMADESKRRIFDWAVEANALVLAFHFFPFPSLGHVVKRGQGWKWQPRTVD